MKVTDALNGPHDDVYAHPKTQSQLDYEGELAVIIGRDAKNVPEERALDYVLGYAASNDVSARNWQTPTKDFGGQFSYSKSFDGFAPLGPAIVSPMIIPDPQALKIVTRVNGQVRQDASTSEMIWSVRQIISHLSMGTTLRRGTVIMTGTPAGVGFFNGAYLKNGDIVDVEIERIGTIANRIVFEPDCTD